MPSRHARERQTTGFRTQSQSALAASVPASPAAVLRSQGTLLVSIPPRPQTGAPKSERACRSVALKAAGVENNRLFLLFPRKLEFPGKKQFGAATNALKLLVVVLGKVLALDQLGIPQGAEISGAFSQIGFSQSHG